jgi:hypothetical protein
MLNPSESSSKIASWTVMMKGVVLGEERHDVVEGMLAKGRAETEGSR